MVKGGYTYQNLHVAQNPNAESAFRKIIADLEPTVVLEIGTFHGGLTLLLREILDESNLQNSKLITYDTEPQVFLKPIVKSRQLDIDVRTENLFSYSYLEWKDKDSKNIISNIIAEGNPILVICDGGCKRCEFRLISSLLKEGDVIMAHDYAPNKEIFEATIKGKIWDWMEIQDSDIDPSCEKHNLAPYLQDVAQEAAWACKIKK